MWRSLAVVVVAGVVIGLLWPAQDKAPAAGAPISTGSNRETVLERESDGHFYTHAKINDSGLVHFVVDTGASVVALTVEDAERLGIPVDPSEFEIVGEGASGYVRGKNVMLKSVEVDGKRVENVRGVVLEGSRLSLLGQAYLSRMGEVEMSGDYMVLK